MTLVAHVHDPVSLASPYLDLVVDLGHQGTDRVNDKTATGASRLNDFRCRAVRGQHDRTTDWNLIDVIHEHDTLMFESFDDDLVVDNLVEAVDRGFERPNHPGQRLDCHLDAGAEAARLSE